MLLIDYHEIKNDPKRIEHLESLFAVIAEILEGSNTVLPNQSTLLIVYGRLSLFFINTIVLNLF